MKAACRANGRAAHIHFGAHITLTRSNTDISLYARSTNIETIARTVTGYLGEGRTIVLSGLGCNFSLNAFRLPKQIRSSVVLYDIYDDLLYDTRGMKRLGKWAIDYFWKIACNNHLILDPALSRRYRHAFHLDNASHLQSNRRQLTQIRRMIYAGSIDDRVDFAWMHAVAKTSIPIDIYGWVHCSSQTAAQYLERLCDEEENITYKGPYDNDELGEILLHYDVGLLPYKTDHKMTKHVNPDKLRHYLNAGLEVLASPIPAVMRHVSYVHIANTQANFLHILAAMLSERRQTKWPVDEHSWDTRWSALVGMIEQTRNGRAD